MHRESRIPVSCLGGKVNHFQDTPLGNELEIHLANRIQPNHKLYLVSNDFSEVQTGW